MRIDNKDIKTAETLPDLRKHVSETMAEITQVINGKLSFSDNFDGRIVSTSFAGVNTDTQLVHGLNRLPIGYVVTKASAPLNVYDGTRASDNNNIYLRSNAVGTANILVF